MNSPAPDATVSPQTARLEPAVNATARRYLSVDALRGFDMIWILGAASIFLALEKMFHRQPFILLATQLEHVDWEGMRFYDLIFPLFVFVMGVSIVFSLIKALQQPEGRKAALKRVFRRFVILFGLALLYSGGFANPWPNIRLLGVLNRIALCYLFASLIFLYFRPRMIAAICTCLLLGYWALMALVPIPKIQLDADALRPLLASAESTNVYALVEGTTEKVTGSYQKGMNLANYLDFRHLPGKRWEVYWDPEGLLSTLPAIATALLGIFAGLLIQNPNVSDQRKVMQLLGWGAVSVAVGFLWGTQFPVIKKIWTSSYVLVAGGYSAMLLAAFYQMVEIWKWERWTLPLVWVGSNAITLYLMNNIFGFGTLARRFAGGSAKAWFDRVVMHGFGDLILALISVGLMLLTAWYLYRKKIFLRV